MRGALAATRADRPASLTGDTRSSTGTAGLDYITPLGNTLGVEARNTSGDAPVNDLVDPTGQFRENEYDEKELAAVAVYNVGPQLRLGARLRATHGTYTLLPGFDFNGTTYRFDAAWRPGNKTLLGFEIYKVPRSVIEVDATHVVARGVAFAPSWAPTAKTVLSARVARENRDFPSDPGAVGLVPVREEVVRLLRLGAGWEATRRFHFGVAWETGERSSNVLGRDYDYNAVMLNGRFVF